MKTEPYSLANAVVKLSQGGNELPENHFDFKNTVQGGLTKREHFAAMAMQGILSGSNCQAMVDHRACDSVAIAELSIIHADALIAELNK